MFLLNAFKIWFSIFLMLHCSPMLFCWASGWSFHLEPGSNVSICYLSWPPSRALLQHCDAHHHICTASKKVPNSKNIPQKFRPRSTPYRARTPLDNLQSLLGQQVDCGPSKVSTIYMDGPLWHMVIVNRKGFILEQLLLVHPICGLVSTCCLTCRITILRKGLNGPWIEGHIHPSIYCTWTQFVSTCCLTCRITIQYNT